MLYITLKNGREIGWYAGYSKPKVAVEQIAEIYVDGDEIGGLFGNMFGNTHGMRGGTLTEGLAQAIYARWQP